MLEGEKSHGGNRVRGTMSMCGELQGEALRWNGERGLVVKVRLEQTLGAVEEVGDVVTWGRALEASRTGRAKALRQEYLEGGKLRVAGPGMWSSR